MGNSDNENGDNNNFWLILKIVLTTIVLVKLGITVILYLNPENIPHRGADANLRTLNEHLIHLYRAARIGFVSSGVASRVCTN